MPDPINSLFSTSQMSTALSSESHVRCMLLFEAALARAEASAGIIPQEAALAITAACRIDLFDVPALYREAAQAGTPAIPLVRMLTSHVSGDAQKFVHWGATSQDAIDTALMLQIRDGLDLLITDLLSLCKSCAHLAEQYHHTPMVGRTLLQQALPITFGLKAARWLALATRQVRSLRERHDHSLAVQFGGAAGTLASLGNNGLLVAELLAQELHLPLPDLPWHTERDRVAQIATTLGVLAGAMAKIANDIALLTQNEVGEVSEGAAPGKGGSSAMPQKHNPVDATMAIASARLAVGLVPVILSAMTQEHERAVGGWQAEWAALPALFRYTACTVERVRAAVTTLQVDPARMSANLALTGGLVMSESLTMTLAPHIGRPAAFRIVQSFCTQVMEKKGDLRQLALKDAQISTILSQKEIEQALDPIAYLGSTDSFIQRALTTYHNL